MRDKWNQRYTDESASQPLAAAVLTKYSHLLPATGSALDLACGLGGNALFLAHHGLNVTAWDISDVAISRLIRAAQIDHLSLQAEVRDVELMPPTPNSFDVIVVSYFLCRSLFPPLVAALRPRGVLFYQTFGIERLQQSPGPSNPKFRLQPGELAIAFSDLRILACHDEGMIGDVSKGFRNTAMIVAQRP